VLYMVAWYLTSLGITPSFDPDYDWFKIVTTFLEISQLQSHPEEGKIS